MSIKSSVAVLFAAFSAGCAIHPVPEDFAGVDTYHIVRQIRCEARETVKVALLDWLSTLARYGNPRAMEILRSYDSDPDTINNFTYERFNQPRDVEIRSVAKLFFKTGVAYNFDLTMTENNDAMASVDFLKPLTEPKFTLGISGGAKRQRVNNRIFTVSDTFSGLLKLNNPVRGKRYCDNHVVQANYIYPIAGRVGIDRMVNDFIRLTLFGNLAGSADKPTGPPTMTDKLSFTTTINASANPVAVFTPVTSAFQVTNAAVTLSAVRTDLHQVTVGLAIDPTGSSELGSVRSYLFSTRRGLSPDKDYSTSLTKPLYIGARVIGGGSLAEQLAIIAVDQVKSREIQIISTQ